MAVGKLVLTDLQSDNNSVFTLVSTGNRAITYLHDLDGGSAEYCLQHAHYSREFSIKIDGTKRAISLFHDGRKVFTLVGEVIHNNEMYRYGQEPFDLKPLKVGDELHATDHANPMNKLVLKIISLNA